jgi:hypothetical protein
MTEYESGWHRQKVGLMPKLAAYTPITFTKGLITGVTDLEDPGHNLWGVAVVAPVEEVFGEVQEVLHQELRTTFETLAVANDKAVFVMKVLGPLPPA